MSSYFAKMGPRRRAAGGVVCSYLGLGLAPTGGLPQQVEPEGLFQAESEGQEMEVEVKGYSIMSYRFPSIPRPHRQMFYYYNPFSSIKGKLSNIPYPRSYLSNQGASVNFGAMNRLGRQFRPGYMNYNTPLSNVTTKGNSKRYFTVSSKSKKKSKTKNAPRTSRFRYRRRIRFNIWAIPAFTVVFYTFFKGIYSRRPGTRTGFVEEEAEVKPAGPWKVAAYSTLPLKGISRLWGKINDITLPMWLRSPTYKTYSYLFGVNLDEVSEPDLRKYANLGEFFYRELKSGARPVDPESLLVSPADGTVLRLGVVEGEYIEQVKGVTYSLSTFLGPNSTTHQPSSIHSKSIEFNHDDENLDHDQDMHREFALMNGINLSPNGEVLADECVTRPMTQLEGDASLSEYESDTSSDFNQVADDLVSQSGSLTTADKELFYSVIYLAPGDYHRFHSPTNWVSMMRRHFVGELYSVAPYFQRKLSGLFVLNERVALLGKWKYGFFSMTPVGATNVGSIKVHFDKELKTNTGQRHQKKNTCYEATYHNASQVLNGYPLTKGQQMGGFNLGSTVVLVFEAPKSFKFNVKAGQKVSVGQSLGGLS